LQIFATVEHDGVVLVVAPAVAENGVTRELDAELGLGLARLRYELE
jgi:hypothetical protein